MPRSIYGQTKREIPHIESDRPTKKRKRKKTPVEIFLINFIKYFVKKALPENSNFKVEINSSHLRHTNYLYRLNYTTKHILKIAFLFILGIIKSVMPIIIPMTGVAVVIFSIWATSTYSVALDVMLDSEHIAYVSDQQTFDDIRASVESKIYSSGEGEYMTDSIPTLKFVIIEKDNLTDNSEIAETLYNSYQEYIGQSYGLYLDGIILGTTKNESEFTRLLDEIASVYITGEKGETYTILNTLEIVRDTYPKSYERTYEELLSLFKTSDTPTVHTVKKNETAEDIAAEYGTSVPVLTLLNSDININSLSAGQNIIVGRPQAELRIETVRYVSYTDVEGFDTKYIYTNDLFEGVKETKQKGSNGIYEVTAEVRSVNGVETYREEISRKKVKDAVSQQILVGTKTIAPSGTFIWPLEGHAGYVSSGFGSRTLRGVKDFHRGTDIAADYGTKILAADAGVIVQYGYQSGGLGNYLAIDHGNGIISYYGHCSSLNKSLSKGSKVYQGQVIAYVGSTGNSTGNHLHFALYNTEKDSYFDPLPYID